MNTKRINYMVHNSVKITGNYLVGLLEGDGSFYLNKQYMTVHISLVTIAANRFVLDKVREFFLSLLDEHSYILGNTTKLISMGENKPIFILEEL